MPGEGFPRWGWLPVVGKGGIQRCSPWLPKGIIPLPGKGISWRLPRSTVLHKKSFTEIDMIP
jgi:hypothetical protein